MTAFASRILVAAAGIPLVLGLIWLGGWWLFALAAVAATFALHEFYVMTRSLRPLVLAGYLGTLAALVGAELGSAAWMVGGFLATLGLAFVLMSFAETKMPTTVSVGVTVLGAAWIGLGLAHVLLIRDIPEHAQLVTLTVLLAVWAGDTFAYLAGRLLGRHKLAPATSPGKTWEGFIAGTAATVLVTFFALYDERHDFLPVWQAILLGVVIALTAPLGDLFESSIKRDMQVKDSGRLLAGHGGMLDRIDAVLFAGVASFYCLLAFGVA